MNISKFPRSSDFGGLQSCCFGLTIGNAQAARNRVPEVILTSVTVRQYPALTPRLLPKPLPPIEEQINGVETPTCSPSQQQRELTPLS
jgi:hypothetical protein